MAGVTDRAYRVLLRELGAKWVFTELVSAEAFYHGSKRTLEMIDWAEEEGPCSVQIFGADPSKCSALAKASVERGAAGVDINFGCPVPKVAKQGAGAGALRDLKSMEVLCGKVREAVDVPLSIKIRTGWDESSIVAREVMELAERIGLDWVTIHGRTRELGYSGESDWQLIEDLGRSYSTPVVGNGDLRGEEEVLERLKNSPLAGVMVGRALLVDPTLFGRLESMRLGESPKRWSIHELILRYRELVDRFTHPKSATIRFKKFIIWLSYGHLEAHDFRRNLLREASNLEDAHGSALSFFSPEEGPRVPHDLQFLKGGHG